jgi:hypothetical protein
MNKSFAPHAKFVYSVISVLVFILFAIGHGSLGAGNPRAAQQKMAVAALTGCYAHPPQPSSNRPISLSIAQRRLVMPTPLMGMPIKNCELASVNGSASKHRKPIQPDCIRVGL